MSIFSRRKFLTLLGLAPVAGKAIADVAKAGPGQVLTREDADRNLIAVRDLIDRTVDRVKFFNPHDKEQWVWVEQTKSLRFRAPDRTIMKFNLTPPR